MDLVISLMKEVESKEQAAEQAKQEAASSSLDILAKVDEVKEARHHAKETNDKHAREVYAQKAVLATEIKELESRVAGVLSEEDKSLGFLDEMHRALEMRLTSAVREKELADEEKIEKQVLAQKELAYEERQMEKIVEESKRLAQEAVKISKLQEYLIDRGQVVDMLREEISDKCEHVNLLKELLDQEVMQRELFSSSPTSSILSSIIGCHYPELKKNDSNENPKESAEPADSLVSFDSTDGHDQFASCQKIQTESGKTITTAILSPYDQLLSKIPKLDLDLQKQEGNKNGSSETDIQIAPVDEVITVTGHSMSTEDLVVSAETCGERVALQSTVKKDYLRKWKRIRRSSK